MNCPFIRGIRKIFRQMICPHEIKEVYINPLDGECHYECVRCGKWTHKFNINEAR